MKPWNFFSTLNLFCLHFCKQRNSAEAFRSLPSFSAVFTLHLTIVPKHSGSHYSFLMQLHHTDTRQLKLKTVSVQNMASLHYLATVWLVMKRWFLLPNSLNLSNGKLRNIAFDNSSLAFRRLYNTQYKTASLCVVFLREVDRRAPPEFRFQQQLRGEVAQLASVFRDDEKKKQRFGPEFSVRTEQSHEITAARSMSRNKLPAPRRPGGWGSERRSRASRLRRTLNRK